MTDKERIDVITILIERAKQRIAEAYGLPDEVADMLNLVANEVRQEIGGTRVTVPKHQAVDPDRVRRDYLANVDAGDITSRHGISRATMYRMLKR
jgi:hypothetical protein